LVVRETFPTTHFRREDINDLGLEVDSTDGADRQCFRVPREIWESIKENDLKITKENHWY
jgi:hypothetical protein